MPAAQTTRVFGLKIGVDPKLLVASLVAISALLFWYTSQPDGEAGPVSGPSAAYGAIQADASRGSTRSQTRDIGGGRKLLSANHSGLRVRAIDGSHGDIDPTLHLYLLSRVRTQEDVDGQRNVFEAVKPPVAKTEPIQAPVLMPEPLPVVHAPVLAPAMAQAEIPLKYCGFVRDPGKLRADRGLFMDGEAVVIAGEGDVVKGRYRIEKLSQTSAKLEDTQAKLAQVLPVAAEIPR